jgi:hypothetical protein
VNASESFTAYCPAGGNRLPIRGCRDHEYGSDSNLLIAAADIHGMSSPEERLMKAVWGKPEVMYDRRQQKPRRSGWRGGRRATDWPEAFGTRRRERRSKPSKLVM